MSMLNNNSSDTITEQLSIKTPVNMKDSARIKNTTPLSSKSTKKISVTPSRVKVTNKDEYRDEYRVDNEESNV